MYSIIYAFRYASINQPTNRNAMHNMQYTAECYQVWTGL